MVVTVQLQATVLVEEGYGKRAGEWARTAERQRKQRTREERRAKVEMDRKEEVCLFVGCLTSQQHASVSQGRICSDNFTCCHTEIEVADQTFHLTQSQYTDTRPTSPSANPVTPGAWSANV